MKFCIMHESVGRMRIQVSRARMTAHQADVLHQYLQSSPLVRYAAVHERTRCAIVEYCAPRKDVLAYMAQFSFEKYADSCPATAHSARELNRLYQEKMLCTVAFKAVRTLFFPAAWRMAYTLWHAVPYLARGLRCLVQGKLRVEVLDALSIGISLLRRDFDTAGSVMFLLRMGELLEEWTHKKSVDDLARCMALNVDRAWVKTSDGEVLTPVQQIVRGDCIVLRTGALVPLDGEIERGEVMVNQASLTGESIPVPKRKGMSLLAGTVVEEGECLLRVTQQCADSRYNKIVAMIEQSERLKSGAEGKAAHLADRLVPYTLAGSAATYLFTRNATRALSVLMVDFSCALKLAMPLAVLSAMREASTYHITVKGGKYLEAVAQADTVIFDKTGTLTYACPTVTQVVPFCGQRAREMLRLAACLEEHFPHSMANAVVQAAREQRLAHEEMHTQVEYVVAHGIASTCNGQRVVIGSAHFVFEDEGCVVRSEDKPAFDALPVECSHLYMALGGVLCAVVCIADPLRIEAEAVVNTLRKLGVKNTVMLTGDSHRTAAAIAALVGVDTYCAEVLPEDKARYVEALRAQAHTVMMLGDGINDSPALSAANVGIAISDGAAIAREIADITIAADDLYELVTLRIIAACLMRRIRKNYRFIVGFNGMLIALGALGVLQPATAALLHNLSTLGISLQSMTNLLGNAPLIQRLQEAQE